MNTYEKFVVGALITVMLNQFLVIGGTVYAAKKVQNIITEVDIGIVQDLFYHWWGQTENRILSSWREFAEKYGDHITIAGDWIRWAWDWFGEDWLSPEEQQWWDEEGAWGATHSWDFWDGW